MFADNHPGQVGLRLGYDGTLAHGIEAGADMFLVPSVYESCGLNQLYSLRYGTPPIVNPTRDLADTVVKADEYLTTEGIGTGFWLAAPTGDALVAAIHRATHLWRSPTQWRHLKRNGMQQKFSWDISATRCLAPYKDLAAHRLPGVPT